MIVAGTSKHRFISLDLQYLVHKPINIGGIF